MLKRVGLLLVMVLFITPQVYAISQEKTIVVSSYPLLKLIEGLFSQAKLYPLLPPKGDFHHYELKPKDLQVIRRADLVIIVGSEPWAKRIGKVKPKRLLSLIDPAEKILDPHVWFNLEAIERLLQDLKTEGEVNLLTEEIKRIKQEKKTLSQCPGKSLFHLGHRVFTFLLEGTGVEEIPLISGPHHGEISLRQLQRFLEGVKKRGVTRLILSSSEFERYAPYFQKMGVEMVRAYSGDEPIQQNFPEFIRVNLKAIKKVLGCVD